MSVGVPVSGSSMSVAAFGKPVADAINGLPSQLGAVAFKSADTARASTVTPTNDPHLVLPVVANSIYELYWTLFANGAGVAGAGDIIIRFLFPTPNATLYIGGTGLLFNVAYGASTGGQVNAQSSVDTAGTSANLAYGTPNGSSFGTILGSGLLIVGNTPGNLQLQWAQRATSATATTLRAGSRLSARKL